MDAQRPTLEVCCGSTRFALDAMRAGADRVELCANLVEGGTTPSHGEIALAIERVSLPVMVMIRPRGGDFLYSDVEYEIMRADIEVAKQEGASGVVIGMLQADGMVDLERTRELVGAARPMSVTFHRAFDVSNGLERNLETLLRAKVDRVLTSAGVAHVTNALPRLESLAAIAGDDLTILACGGVRDTNVDDVLSVRGIREVHIGASTTSPSPMRHRVLDVPMGRAYEPDEYLLERADGPLIERGAARVAAR